MLDSDLTFAKSFNYRVLKQVLIRNSEILSLQFDILINITNCSEILHGRLMKCLIMFLLYINSDLVLQTHSTELL